jgi:hypothetical protein
VIKLFGLQHSGDPARPVERHGMTEQSLFDTALNFLRPQLVTIPGAAVPGTLTAASRGWYRSTWIRAPCSPRA